MALRARGNVMPACRSPMKTRYVPLAAAIAAWAAQTRPRVRGKYRKVTASCSSTAPRYRPMLTAIQSDQQTSRLLLGPHAPVAVLRPLGPLRSTADPEGRPMVQVLFVRLASKLALHEPAAVPVLPASELLLWAPPP